MRKLTSLVAAVVLAAGMAFVVAAPAGASVDAKTSKFCKAVKNYNTSNLGNPTSKSGAKKTLKGLKKLQAAATGSTKKAMNTIVGAYQTVANGGSARDAFAKTKVVKAFASFGVAAAKCVVSDIPNITLPKNITLPNNITLPGG